MARDLDDYQQRELSEFVNRVAEAAGYTTTAEWARDAGYPAPNLGNLRNGKSGIDGYNLFRLIRAAALRAGVADDLLAARAAAEGEGGAAGDLSIRGRLAMLEATVAELPTAADLKDAVETVLAWLPSAGSAGTAEAPPEKPAGRRAAR